MKDIFIKIEECCKAINSYELEIRPFEFVNEEGYMALRVFMPRYHNFPVYYCPACGKEIKILFKNE